MRRLSLLSALWLCASPFSYAQYATFNTVTNVLTIPYVTVGTTTYRSAQLALPPGGNWSLLAIGEPAAPQTLAGSCPDPLVDTGALALSVTPATLAAGTGQSVNFVVSGGVPPYRAVLTDSSASVLTYFEPDRNLPFTVGSLSVGSLTGTGSTLLVIDCTGKVVSVPFTRTAAASVDAGTFAVSPAGVSGRFGAGFTLLISGGAPPYAAVVSTGHDVVSIDGIDWDGSSARAYLRVHLTREAGSASLLVIDSNNTVIQIPVAAHL